MKNSQRTHLSLQIKGIALSVNGSVHDPRSMTGIFFAHWQLHQKLFSSVFVYRELCAHWMHSRDPFCFQHLPMGLSGLKEKNPALICHIAARALCTCLRPLHPPRNELLKHETYDCYNYFHFQLFKEQVIYASLLIVFWHPYNEFI